MSDISLSPDAPKHLADGPYGPTGEPRNYVVGEAIDQRLIAWMSEIRMLAYGLIEKDRLATIVIEDLDGIVTVSEGVVGWHLNGDVLRWDQVECLTALGEWLDLAHHQLTGTSDA